MDELNLALESMNLAAKCHDRKRSLTYTPIISTSPSSSSNTFQHAQVQDRRFRAGSVFTLMRRKHRIDELAASICDQLRVGFGPGHEDLLRQYRLWYTHLHQQLAIYHATEVLPTKQFMDTGIKIISTLFLLGGLHCCKFTWDPQLFENDRLYGLCGPHRQYEREWFHIHMDPGDHHVTFGAHSYAASILGTLLHECVHGLLNIYSCTTYNEQYPNCRSQRCKKLYNHSMGCTWHGPAFVQIASHVEALTKQALGEDIPLLLERFGSHREYFEGERIMSSDEVALCHPAFHGTMTTFRERALQVEECISKARRTDANFEGRSKERIKEVLKRFRREAIFQSPKTAVEKLMFVW